MQGGKKNWTSRFWLDWQWDERDGAGTWFRGSGKQRSTLEKLEPIYGFGVREKGIIGQGFSREKAGGSWECYCLSHKNNSINVSPLSFHFQNEISSTVMSNWILSLLVYLDSPPVTLNNQEWPACRERSRCVPQINWLCYRALQCEVVAM